MVNAAGQDISAQLIAGMQRGAVDESFGQLTQSGQPGYSARSNAYAGTNNATDGALAGTGVMAFVPVPVALGDIITRISLPIGATPGATMTHQWAAVYSGMPTLAASTLLSQSADATSAAIPASGVVGWTLQTPVTVTKANAPAGFLYVGVMIAAATVPSAASASTPAAINYQYFSTGPSLLAGTVGSGLTTTAPANLTGGAAKAAAPICILS